MIKPADDLCPAIHGGTRSTFASEQQGGSKMTSTRLSSQSTIVVQTSKYSIFEVFSSKYSVSSIFDVDRSSWEHKFAEESEIFVATLGRKLSIVNNTFCARPLWGEESFVHGTDGMRSCLLYTSPSPRDKRQSRMPSSA